jgi:D-tagatose-1,6-bisphosphate aldolase subunit GatZ/KbaZ
MNQKNNYLQDMVLAQKNDVPIGMYSICSANPVVLETSVDFAAKLQIPLLIESTCNQVNQYGGYTGMLPNQFIDFVWRLVEKNDLPREKIILGGDHLGPYPWRNESVSNAMQKAKTLVHDYVTAGYSKIHLDASMPCANDDPTNPLDVVEGANRTVALCKIAEDSLEKSGRNDSLFYVIGTEVPSPGGVETNEEIHLTRVTDVRETIEETQKAFLKHGMEDAWDRVIAIVVHPGVDFGNNIIYPYNQDKAVYLTGYIKSQPQLVYEAHSTDYQSQKALRQMVEDQFAILKVGPELTFAYREAIFALEFIETELLDIQAGLPLSNLRSVVDFVMLNNPVHWQKYYKGTEQEQAIARKYSYTDRIRYYWSDPKIQKAISCLYMNLADVEIPSSLISQYFALQQGSIPSSLDFAKPTWLIKNRIQNVLQKYASACGSNI